MCRVVGPTLKGTHRGGQRWHNRFTEVSFELGLEEGYDRGNIPTDSRVEMLFALLEGSANKRPGKFSQTCENLPSQCYHARYGFGFIKGVRTHQRRRRTRPLYYLSLAFSPSAHQPPPFLCTEPSPKPAIFIGTHQQPP
ncbi:Hypothetical predicted protein [Olea europaea subsp. europaea]|uniref:Uncharacterized protein n=1 Tax=Olea europaea subsp. europaea TaxID=158383 RepID=A0A8S0SC80_OLEEU|nr:Hypothetical predicted protein [Olea europaea subsp. europaea]